MTVPSRGLRVFGSALLLAGLVGMSALAQDPPEQEPPAEPQARILAPGETRLPEAVWPEPQRVERRGLLTTKVGHGCLATLPGEIERVALADDSIALVQIISPREVMLTGLRPGETTVHVWLTNGSRYKYVLRVVRDLELAERALKDLDPRISLEVDPDGRNIVLYGEVDDARVARAALARAEALLGGSEVLSVLRYPGSASAEEWLEQALKEIDPRIRVKRIQVGDSESATADSIILEGRVKNVRTLVQAITLADRQLGGTGGRVGAVDDDRVATRRNRNFGGGGFGGQGGQGGLQAGAGGGGVGGTDPTSSSLSTQLARGLMITSQSGRVVSLLEVDELPQVMVSIRVMEIDRTKSRQAGFNLRFDREHVSVGSYLSPGIDRLPTTGGPVPTVDGVSGTNIVGAFIDQTSAIVAAIDFLQQKNLARSVAEPNVLTLSGELASVVVGGEVPIPTTTTNQVATLQGFQFQTFGVRLDIRPTVTMNDIVALEVSPSIVRPIPGLGVTGVPGFQVQSVTTTARVQAGQSLVIGGLLSFEDGLEDRRLPGLGRIPLFRWKRKSRQERELLFLITPRLVELEDRPTPPVNATPDLEDLELPELNWPYERNHWRDEFDPIYLPPNGVPEVFIRRDDDDILDAIRGGDTPYGDTPYEDTGTWAEPPAGDMPVEGLETASEESMPDSWVESEPTAMRGSIEFESLPDPSALVWQVSKTVSSCLNLRDQPGLWNNVIACIEPGTKLEVRGADGGWRWIHLADGRQGWVAAAYLEAAGAGDDAEAATTDD